MDDIFAASNYFTIKNDKQYDLHLSVCNDKYCPCGKYYSNQSGKLPAPLPRVTGVLRNIDDCRFVHELTYHYLNCVNPTCRCNREIGTVLKPQFSGGLYAVPSRRFINQSGIAQANVQELTPLCEQVFTTCFENDDASPIYEIKSEPDITSSLVSMPQSDIETFLKRPVLIASLTFPVNGSGVSLNSFNPWSAFYNNPAIRNKLANFYLLRSKLRVKFVVTGGPFHMGRFLVSYCPMHNFCSSFSPSNAVPMQAILESQRPHLYLDPTTNQGGELVLPFFYPKDYARLIYSDISQLGLLTVRELCITKTVNGSTTPVTISVFAMAEDVKLAAPTAQPLAVQLLDVDENLQYQFDPQYTNQSGEYSETPVANLLTSASKVASVASNIIWFKPYAKATEMVLSTMGKIAAALGFSRPVILDNHKIIKNGSLYYMSNSDRHDPVQKLSLSSKQELTIDPRVVGLSGDDEMSISSIVKRESFLFMVPWNTTQTTGTIIGSCCVSPDLADTGPDGGVYMIPMCWVAQAFRKWRGTINFRLVIVASAQHKGRIMVTYEPAMANTQAIASSSLNTNISKVIDISQTKDITIPVRWNQDTPFREMQIATKQWFSGSADTVYHYHLNGNLIITVLNQLTLPGATVEGVQILVMVSGGDDLEFAEPTNGRIDQWSPFTNQSGEIVDAIAPGATTHIGENLPYGEHIITPMGSTSNSDKVFEVFYGERITSLRQLLKRYCYTFVYAPPLAYRQISTSATTVMITKHLWGMPAHPPPYGYDPRGQFTTSGVKAKHYNAINQSLLSYFSLGYVAQRGGVRWKFTLDGNQTLQASTFKAYRDTYWEDNSANLVTSTTIFADYNKDGDGVLARTLSGNIGYTSGCAVTPVYDGTGLEVEVPNYSQYRFNMPRHFGAADGLATVDRITCEAISQNSVTPAAPPQMYMAEGYTAAAEDYSLMGFIGPPVLYKYALSTTI